MENTTPTLSYNPLIKRISPEEISRLILTVRKEHVLLSPQIAKLYNMEVRVLNQTVKRNPKYFPEESFFQLSKDESHDIDLVTPYPSWGGARRSRPYAFTVTAIISLHYLLKKHGSDELNFDIVRAFKLKENRYKIS